MESASILAVDDEMGILKLLRSRFAKRTLRILTRHYRAKAGRSRIKEKAYDMILLDIMLPDLSGFELCTEIRKHTNAPIIFISARSTDFDKLTGLGIGGDDYITKPFNPMEVIARIKAILRRQRIMENAHQQNSAYDYGYFSFHPESATLTVKGQPIDCTAKELELSQFFVNIRIISSQRLSCTNWYGE